MFLTIHNFKKAKNCYYANKPPKNYGLLSTFMQKLACLDNHK